MRESVVMYVSTYSAILKRIPSIEQREAIFEAIFNYAFYDEPIQEFDDPTADAIMDMVKPLIDSNNRNYVNGRKGGRPKKEETDNEKPLVKTTGKNHRIKPPDEPPGKGNVNVDKNVNENDNGDSHLRSYKEGDAHSPSAGAGGAHTFTLTDVQQCVEDNDIDLSDKGITAFYEWMGKYDWKINKRKVTKLENALSGFARKHPEYSLDQAEQKETEPVTPSKYLETFKIWLRYHDYADGGEGDFSEEISISDEVIDTIFEVEDMNEPVSQINDRLCEQFGEKEVSPFMELFRKWVKEKKYDNLRRRNRKETKE